MPTFGPVPPLKLKSTVPSTKHRAMRTFDQPSYVVNGPAIRYATIGAAKAMHVIEVRPGRRGEAAVQAAIGVQARDIGHGDAIVAGETPCDQNLAIRLQRKRSDRPARAFSQGLNVSSTLPFVFTRVTRPTCFPL